MRAPRHSSPAISPSTRRSDTSGWLAFLFAPTQHTHNQPSTSRTNHTQAYATTSTRPWKICLRRRGLLDITKSKGCALRPSDHHPHTYTPSHRTPSTPQAQPLFDLLPSEPDSANKFKMEAEVQASHNFAQAEEEVRLVGVDLCLRHMLCLRVAPSFLPSYPSFLILLSLILPL
jgi:hypothetical protein